MAGGIIGRADNEIYLENCVNFGTISGGSISSGGSTSGGIIGLSTTSNCIVNKCKNMGKSLGGIIGKVIVGANIINCCNYGECNSGIVNICAGQDWSINIELNIKNCYNLGKTSYGIVGSQGIYCATNTINIENCYNAGQCEKAIIGSITYREGQTITTTNVINTYYDQTKSISVGAVTEGIEALNEEDIKNNETFIETLNNNIGENTDWKRWKIGEDGYPTFE